MAAKNKEEDLKKIEKVFIDEMIKKRKKLKLTQSELAELTNTSQRIISAIERNDISIRVAYMALFVKYLNLDVEEIFNKMKETIDNMGNWGGKHELTPQEKLLIERMVKQNLPIHQIAQILEKSEDIIQKYLSDISIDSSL